MKSTKNVLMTGVALAIALFASVQVTAMEGKRAMNPYLKKDDLKFLQRQIGHTKESIKIFSDQNSQYYNPESAETLKKILEKQESILYGDRPVRAGWYLEIDMVS